MFAGFPKDTIEFLCDLSDNNTRDWFAANKERYEQSFLAPSLEFISAVEKPLLRVAPMLEAKAKRVGGSLMRIYKDTRFSNDKTPYKTNIGIQFRHSAGKDVHAPGIYLHIAEDECFVGAGMWRPDSTATQGIRAAIEAEPKAWQKAVGGKRFTDAFELYDDRLKTAPRGVAKDHPMIESLRLKSFLGMSKLTRKQIESPTLVDSLIQHIKAAAPLMNFLCKAVGQPY